MVFLIETSDISFFSVDEINREHQHNQEQRRERKDRCHLGVSDRPKKTTVRNATLLFSSIVLDSLHFSAEETLDLDGDDDGDDDNPIYISYSISKLWPCFYAYLQF